MVKVRPNNSRSAFARFVVARCHIFHFMMRTRVRCFSRNRLSPRFIYEAQRSNRYIVMSETSYKQIKDKKKEKLRSIKLATEEAVEIKGTRAPRHRLQGGNDAF